MTVVPDGAQRLSEGLLVEASIVARLLRIRLLVIEASLVVAPAQLEGEPRALGAPRTGGDAIGAGLAAAERSLSEAAAGLRQLDADA